MLLPEDRKAMLPALYAQEQVADPIVHLHLFFPHTHWHWFVTEGEQRGDDVLFFGWICSENSEMGYFALSELESLEIPTETLIQNVDKTHPFFAVINSHASRFKKLRTLRDETWTPKPLSEVKKDYGE